MKVVVDTNIVFSALLRTQTTFGEIIFNSGGIFEFYSPQYLRVEIRRHWNKLLKLSKLSEAQLEESYYRLLTRISFVDEEIISKKIWEESERIATRIDLDDTQFIALTKHLRGRLWTGDQALRNGLLKKGFKRVMTTPEVVKRWKSKIQ